MGLVVLAPHASELALAPAARAAAHLARGERVLLLAPAALPALGEAWSAWAVATSAALAVVPDDELGLLREALGAPQLVRFEASGPPARIEVLQEWCAAAPRTVSVELRVLRNTSLVVRAGDDPEAAAREAAQRAFGRVRALSGQRAGALGRVVCHERVLSRFTAALLSAIEALPGPPLALLERATREHLAAARALGLDEGATPLLSEPDLTRLVFTNVDARLELARLARCAPLLCLVRAGDDEEGRALAQRLDDDARCADLAGTR